ncbi:MAG: hypothetical protein U0572_17450 [Phycisphaerales bacterium]
MLSARGYPSCVQDMSDTPLHVERIQAAILARKSEDERWRIALELTGYVLRNAMRAIMETTGGDRDAARVRLVQLLHGDALARGFEAALRARGPDGNR